MASDFELKDSGQRQQFASGMIRDTTEGKVNFLNVRFGPMLRRWAEHMTKGRVKYPDVEPGVPNWTLASGVAEYLRAKESAERHFDAWVRGERDEDHAAGVFFNLNLAEYILEQDPTIDPAQGAAKLAEARPPQVLFSEHRHTGEFRQPIEGEWFQGIDGSTQPYRAVDNRDRGQVNSSQWGFRRWILK